MNEFENKVVLVTGATGLIGSNLVFRLLNCGAYIIAVGRSKSKLESCFATNENFSRIQLVEHDMSQPLDNIKDKIDYIFHAASPIAGSIIKENPVSVILPNIKGTINCLEYLKEQREKTGIEGRLVLFSSATVYGVNNSLDREVLEENTELADSLDALNAPYSESKRMIEVIAKAYVKECSVSTVIARFAYVYGPTYFMPNTAFYEFVQNVLEGKDIILNSNNAQRRDNIYVDDAVNGVLHVALYGKDGESYNISSNGDGNNYLAIDELAKIIAQNGEKIVSVSYKNEGHFDRTPGVRLNNDKIKNLGWNIQVDAQTGIKKTIEVYNERLTIKSQALK